MKRYSTAQAVSIGLLFLLASACQRPVQEERLRVVFTGDVLLDRGVKTVMDHHGTAWLFDSVSHVFNRADAVVINLECPLTDTLSPLNKQFIFRAASKEAAALRQAGITHAALANNHTNDQGRRGLADTHHHLLQAGITPLGYGLTHAERLTPCIISKGQTRMALFNAVMFPLENWVSLDSCAGICIPSAESLAAAVSQHRSRHKNDFIVCILHWGTEFQTTPSLTQRRIASRLNAAGTDLIVGHHPHVLQPIDTLGQTTICYSLGNFVFDQRQPIATRSLLLEVEAIHFPTAGHSLTILPHPATIRNCRPILN